MADSYALDPSLARRRFGVRYAVKEVMTLGPKEVDLIEHVKAEIQQNTAELSRSRDTSKHTSNTHI